MGTTHTPGPWFWCRTNPDYPETVLQRENGQLVMAIYESHGGGEMPNKADAQLIASAPRLLSQKNELLETLSILVLRCARHSPMMDREGDLDDARALIEKVRYE